MRGTFPSGRVEGSFSRRKDEGKFLQEKELRVVFLGGRVDGSFFRMKD